MGLIDLLPRLKTGESRAVGYSGLRIIRRVLAVGIHESG